MVLNRNKKKRDYAKSLRTLGFSLEEISKKVGISKSTASLWLSGIYLSKAAINRLKEKQEIGRIKARAKRKDRRVQENNHLLHEAKVLVRRITSKKDQLLIFCTLLFECEGTKDISGGVYFTNSNPKVVAMFLYFFRKCFKLDESRFRASLHVHEYHDQKKQIDFWSHVTRIPCKQFIKPYLKPHTAKNKREGYEGCVSVRYLDTKIARQLKAVSYALLEKYGGVR